MSEMFKTKLKEVIYDSCRIQGYFQFKSENSEIAQKGIKKVNDIIIIISDLLESGILWVKKIIWK